jgi:hypothetical protein
MEERITPDTEIRIPLTPEPIHIGGWAISFPAISAGFAAAIIVAKAEVHGPHWEPVVQVAISPFIIMDVEV